MTKRVVFLTFLMIAGSTQAADLFLAAKSGNPGLLQEAIEKTEDINAMEEGSGQTALMMAAKGNHPHAVEALIKAGADVQAMSKYGTTALHYAPFAGIDEKDSRGFRMVKMLHEAGAQISPDGSSYTPLLAAVEANDHRSVKYMLERDADVNAEDQYERSVLSLSLETVNPKLLSEVVKRNPSGLSEISNLTNILRRFSCWRKPCAEEESFRQSFEIVLKAFLNAGGNLNEPLDERNEANILTAVVSGGAVETALLLIKSGAEVQVEQEGLLGYAVSTQSLELVKALREGGAVFETADRYENEPAFLVALELISGERVCNRFWEDGNSVTKCNHENLQKLVEIIQWLIQEGSPLYSYYVTRMVETIYYTNKEETEIVAAAMENLLKFIATSQVEPTNFHFSTISTAVDTGKTSLVQLLLDIGYDVNLATEKGHTLLMRAVEKEDLNMVEFLVEVGADVSAENADGASAIMIAKVKGYKNIASLLEEQKKKN